MDFYGTTIYGNGIGIYNRQDRNAIIENVNIYGNTSAGIYNNAGTVAVKSGYIHENKSGIDNAGTLNISGGNVYENSVNGIVNTGTLNYSGGNIYGNASNGVVTNGTAEFSGGSIYSNAGSGLSVTGGTSTLKGSVAVRNNVGSGVYNLSGTVNINGGEIKDNGNSNVSNNGTLNMSGGSVHGTAAYGIANSKTLNISGGNVYDSSSSGIFNSGTVAKATITGGSFWSNGYDVYHAGEAGAAGLIINSGANSGNNMSVYLSYVDRYITTDSTHPFSVTIADSCYVRGKILVNTNPESVGSAAGVYAVMSFLDKNQLTADANKTFYVCYYPIKYIIHFDGNGSTSGSMSDIATLYDVPVTLPTHGYTRVTENGESTFKGWNIIPSPDHFEILYGENAT